MRKILLALLLALASHSAYASQYNPVLPTSSPYPGLTMLSNLNSAFQGILTSNAGATAPSYGVEGSFFTNTSGGLVEFYTGSNWVNLGTFSTTQFASVNNGVPYTIPSSTGSANAYVVTYSPAPTAYVTGQHYSFRSNFANTTTASENVNALGAKTITKQGAVALASGDIPSGAVVDTVYDGTEMQMVSQTGNVSSGTVTSVATTGAVCGGPITGSGTVALCAAASGTIVSNVSGSSAASVSNSTSSVLDNLLTSTQGTVAYRNATGWVGLAVGTAGQFLKTAGAAANPVWASQLVVYVGGTLGVTLPGGATNFMFLGSSASAASVIVDLPTGKLGSGTNGGFFVQSSLGLPTGETAAFTIFDENTSSSTGITCTMTGPSGQCSDTTHTYSTSSSHALAIQVITSSGTGSNSYTFTLSEAIP